MSAMRRHRDSLVTRLADCQQTRRPHGVCIWFTARSGADTTAIVGVLAERLLEYGRATTTLDQDVVRTHLLQGLGLTRGDRETSVRRIGFVAAEIVRHGGTVICTAISPHRSVREDIRQTVGTDCFIEVRLDTLRRIGVTRDPGESRAAAERVRADAARSPAENAVAVIEHLMRAGFLRRASDVPRQRDGGHDDAPDGPHGSRERWRAAADHDSATDLGTMATDATVAHSLSRWADTVVKSVASPSDLRTLNEWGRFVGVSVGGLRNWCRTADLPARRSLLFARLLRAVIRQRGTEMTPDVLLNVVDRRTLAKLVAVAGGTSGQLPHTLEDFLARQQLIRKTRALATIRLALGDGTRERASDAVRFELRHTMETA